MDHSLSNILSTPEKSLAYALAIAAVSGAGWLISQAVAIYLDRRRQQKIWQLEFTAKQLSELYGPLALLITEGGRRFVTC
jgi:hypothetical protein